MNCSTRKLFMFFGSTVLLAGCNQSVESRIVGKWSTGENKYMEFFRDHTVIKGHLRGSGPDDGGGKWGVIDGNRVKVDFNSMFGTVSLVMEDVEFQGNAMSFTFQGQQNTLIRIE